MSRTGVSRTVLPFRRKRSWKRRVTDAARSAPKRGRELRDAAAQLDLPWARCWLGAAAKARVIVAPTRPSHVDTPVILSALPRRLRKRTAVAAAADYFYRNRVVASAVSLIFNTVPIERRGGGGLAKNGSHLDTLLDQGWNLLLYPEGTRSRGGVPGRVRRGAAVLASAHNLWIVPIRVTGTAAAMPPGRIWPKRLHGTLLSKRHRIEVSFGEPIRPSEDAGALIERVQSFFENGDGGPPVSPSRRARLTGSRQEWSKRE